ncbi:MAG TPA: zinc ABC transporter substrate-binding protein [Acidiferrobacterales bacterium]|nr:zinc ABC transporter substrate-binding protein [Acidiferrobacterales bacterium]
MKTMIKFAILASLLTLTQPVLATLRAVACEPEWGALLQELGGDDVSVYTATSALQDPHRIEPRPSLIARLRNADFLICSGAELEIGWLPVLLQQASGRVQPGVPGYFEAASVVRLLEIPARLDRAQGDVHAAGNPHIQTDPRNIAQVAEALAQRLEAVDQAHAANYQARYADFAKRWQAATQRWQAQVGPLKGIRVVVHHKYFTYLEDWLGLQEVGQLEPKPGIPPTIGHMTELLASIKQVPTKMILRSAYDDPRGDEWFSERAHIPAVLLPGTVDGTPEAKDLFSLFDVTVQTLLKNAK